MGHDHGQMLVECVSKTLAADDRTKPELRQAGPGCAN
jgi:hypothetical protein